MRNDKLNQEQKQVISNNNGLKMYLVSLSKGRSYTPRSWLYESLEPEAILDKWLNQLSTLDKGTSHEKRVFQFDTSQLEKWGPQGGIAPISELTDIVEEGFSLGDSPRPELFQTPEWEAAKASVSKRLATITGGALRPASYKSVVDDMRARDVLESNSGWPLFTRRSKPEVKEASIRDAESGEWKNYPAIALFRNYNKKTRLVWMFPMSANLVEGSFSQPLQSCLINHADQLPEIAPWVGFEAVRTIVTQVYSTTDETLSASDFTSTDAHFTHWHTEQVFDVIKHCYQKKYHDALHESLMHMHSIPLVTGEDSILTGMHGVSSGSNWTNFVETIFDIILGYYVASKTESNTRCLYAIGDDMSWCSRQYDEGFAEQLEEIGKAVGQIIKAEKTTNNVDWVKSLQRLFQRGYSRPDGQIRAVYSTIRALKSSVYPERFHKPELWSSDMFCARQYMILENCVDHPLFEEFVKFVVRGQKDLIPFAKKSKPVLDAILAQSKLLPGLNPTYNQERRDTSLAAFESIRIASEL